MAPRFASSDHGGNKSVADACAAAPPIVTRRSLAVTAAHKRIRRIYKGGGGFVRSSTHSPHILRPRTLSSSAQSLLNVQTLHRFFLQRSCRAISRTRVSSRCRFVIVISQSRGRLDANYLRYRGALIPMILPSPSWARHLGRRLPRRPTSVPCRTTVARYGC